MCGCFRRWLDWQRRSQHWRDVRCMAMLFVQTRARMTKAASAWALGLVEYKRPQRHSLVALASQQWQWRAFCSWIHKTGSMPDPTPANPTMGLFSSEAMDA